MNDAEREIDELVKQEARDTLTRGQTRRYPTMEEILESGVKMRHLTYDARTVIERSKKSDNLTLFWQIWLMLKCYNHGKEYVSKVLDLSSEASLLPVVSGEFGHKTWAKPFNDMKFSAKMIWNLFLVDRLVLVSDYGVPLDRINNYLERLSQETVEELAAQTGKLRMSFFMTEVEEFFGTIEDSRQRLEKASEDPYYIEPTVPVDPAANALLKQSLADIQSIPKEDP